MVFYLKVNREENYTYRNVQRWVDITGMMPGSKVYILCDKDILREKIWNEIDFRNNSIEFIESSRLIEDLKYIVLNATNKRWSNAGYAHLTAFWHAKKNNIKKFWNIDSDDTYFCLKPLRVCEMLHVAEKYAHTNNIAAFSLDMWRTREKGRHWSFGITYIDNLVDWFQIMKLHCKDREWQEDCVQPRNIDGFFTYLKKVANLKIETFYFENLKFIHYSDDFFKRPMASGLFHWKEGKLCFPIVYYCFNSKSLGMLSIADDVLKLDIQISDEESDSFLLYDVIEKDLVQKYSSM